MDRNRGLRDGTLNCAERAEAATGARRSGEVADKVVSKSCLWMGCRCASCDG